MHSIPSLWKIAQLITVIFSPIALTSNIMKCFERLVVNVLKEEDKLSLDPFQFAYKAGQGTKDAIICISRGYPCICPFTFYRF